MGNGADRMIEIGFMLSAAAAAYFAGRYALNRFQISRSPMTEATLQRGGVIVGTGYKPGVSAKGFIGYAYQVNEKRYTGFFAIAGDSGQVASMIESLPGKKVQVRYDAKRPEASVLADAYDPIFGGLLVSQRAEHLLDAPRLRFPGAEEN